MNAMVAHLSTTCGMCPPSERSLRAWLAPHAAIDLRVGGLMRTNYEKQARAGAVEYVARVLDHVQQSAAEDWHAGSDLGRCSTPACARA
jgi:hypothetical protein